VTVPSLATQGPVPLASQTMGVMPVMSMPVITEYQSIGFGVPSTPFGAPITAPRSGASGSSRQPASRRRAANPNGSIIVPRRQRLEITMTFVVLPRDVRLALFCLKLYF
jgi:hypothetical protein